MINHSNPSLRGASATRQSKKIFTGTIAKTATRFGIVVNALCPLRALRCNKNWITRTGRIMTVLILLGFFPLQAWACPKPDPVRIGVDEFISESKDIVLAQTVSAKLMALSENGYPFSAIEYTFEVQDNLKGNSDNRFTKIGRPIYADRDINHFNDHKSSKFWDNEEGRTPDNCFLPLVSYAVGASYLLIGDLDNNYPKKAELIMLQNDRWLQYVRDKVKEQAAND